MSRVVTLIPGDGIGPSITDATLKVLKAAGVDIEWDRRLAGVAAVQEFHTPIPDETLESIRTNKIALKGPLTTPIGTGFRSVNVALRKEFDLYANVRPAKTILEGGRYDNIDLVLIRENTEGLYVGVEHYIGVGKDPKAAAESVMIITRFGAERAVRFAFDYALANGRKKVTLVHKANILKFTQGLFLEEGQKVAAEFNGRIEFEDKIVDAVAMQLVMNPYQFDVLVMENMFGDILSDLIAGLVGGLGLAPGGNIGKDAAIFEAVHGSAPDIVGKGIADPAALLLAACLMLDHMGDKPTADRIRNALTIAIAKKEGVTPDLGGNGTTESFADAIIAQLGS
jgi:isocitrate dehydrogenase (NAD+)